MSFSINSAYAKILKKPPTTVVCVNTDATLPFQNATASRTPTVMSSLATSYWSWTLGITSFPFFVWGCPFFLLVRDRANSAKHYRITNTRAWLKELFNCNYPLMSILALLLIVPTVLINIYVLYVFGDVVNMLFISAVYELSIYYNILGLIRYLPIVIPLDYVWLRGFNINNMIRTLNHLYRKYEGVGCSTFRIRLCIMLLLVIAVHVIRYFSYDKYKFQNVSTWEAIQNSAVFSIDIFCSFLLPLYCTFCYAIRFQLFVVKGFVYKLIARREVPTVGHLGKIKSLYTQAADNILVINNMFSLYLSVALIITIVGTIVDAQSFWGGVLKLLGGTISGPLMVLIGMIASDADPETDVNDGKELSPSEIREINADILCIIVTYGLIFYTMWQAVGTNDCAREINVWVNDLMAGGGGTDVTAVLQELGVIKMEDSVKSIEDIEESRQPLIWARDEIQSDGITDDFIRKVRLLKSYIHVRMQVEKPALLNVALVGLLVPSLGGRLRNYRVVF